MKTFQIASIAAIFTFIGAHVIAQNNGIVMLCNEEQKTAAVNAGVQIVGYSVETDPANPGMHIQYRRVLRTEMVESQHEEGPWYFVYLGPVVPNTNSYVFWPSGDPPPWRKNVNKRPTGAVTYIGVHEHYGCTEKKSFCKRYDNHPVKFDSFRQGKVTGTFGNSGTRFNGTIHGTVFQFTYNAGAPGRGTFNFSPDYRTFTGTFEDDNGHRGIWSGRMQ